MGCKCAKFLDPTKVTPANASKRPSMFTNGTNPVNQHNGQVKRSLGEPTNRPTSGVIANIEHPQHPSPMTHMSDSTMSFERSAVYRSGSIRSAASSQSSESPIARKREVDRSIPLTQQSKTVAGKGVRIGRHSDGVNEDTSVVSDRVGIVNADAEAFNSQFLNQRQAAIDQPLYRSKIESWSPTSLSQLSELLLGLGKNRPLIDRYWIIFYWIACNIEYDAVSYLNHTIPSQSAESVFKTRKGVCAGYSYLYKYLCDQLGLKCDEVSGSAKGFGFDEYNAVEKLQSDHAWNAVQIEERWYLLDSTWGTGHLNEQSRFKRQLNCIYFLMRPDWMIYSHMPENDKWQLLREPITMKQYFQLPQVKSGYFDLNLELINPRYQAHATLAPHKSYSLIVIRAPEDVELIAHLELNGNKIEGGHRILHDAEKHLYRCYFAPASVGKHMIHIFGKRVSSTSKTYGQVVKFPLVIKEMPPNPVSYPQVSKEFYDLGLKVISPVKTHRIQLDNGETHARIVIQAPSDVHLIGDLKTSDQEKLEGGEQVYYNHRDDRWICKFAPNRDGLFEAYIYGKKTSDEGTYPFVVSFKIQAKQIPSPPLSYPKTWSPFHDLHLKIVAPKNCFTVPWSDNASYAEVLVQAPDDVQLSCSIKNNGTKVTNGDLAQLDVEKKLWQLLFAPERCGRHALTVFVRREDDKESKCALEFGLNVTRLERPMKFPTIYKQFHATKSRICEPINGVMKSNAIVPIHCLIPGAAEVTLGIDGTLIKAEGYEDPVLKRQITVGKKDVTIYAKYGDASSYKGLVKYTVQ